MSEPLSLNARIIEGLYCEALVLADEVRSAFTLSGRIEEDGTDEDLARIAMSCEALRTTTRMMHALAWLLNHRAFLMGELSDFQLRRHGRLAADLPGSEPKRVALLAPEIRNLVALTEAFYARLTRLDRGWREAPAAGPAALDRLRERLGKAMA